MIEKVIRSVADLLERLPVFKLIIAALLFLGLPMVFFSGFELSPKGLPQVAPSISWFTLGVGTIAIIGAILLSYATTAHSRPEKPLVEEMQSDGASATTNASPVHARANFIFGSTDEPDGLDTFYNEFRKLLVKSTGPILQVGSGFNCADREGIDRAEAYLRVLTGCAIRTGSYLRIDMGDSDMREWFERVGKFLAHLPGVEIYVPEDSHSSSMLLKDLCIMPMERGDPWIEMVMPVYKPDSLAASEIQEVGDYFFVQSSSWADSWKRSLMKLRNEGVIRKVTSKELLEMAGCHHWHEQGSRKHKYFAYGSNMAVDQIEPRLGRVELVGPRELENYRLVFNVKGTIYENYVANIEPSTDANDSVWGALYEIDDVAVERLDFYEGVNQGEYHQDRVMIDGEPVLVYRQKRGTGAGNPAADYIKKMIGGANAVELPKQYVQKLEEFVPSK